MHLYHSPNLNLRLQFLTHKITSISSYIWVADTEVGYLIFHIQFHSFVMCYTLLLIKEKSVQNKMVLFRRNVGRVTQSV